MEEIDYDALRKDLIDYFGSAAFSGFPVAMMEVFDVERATDSELITIALRAGFNLDNYKVNRNSRW